MPHCQLYLKTFLSGITDLRAPRAINYDAVETQVSSSILMTIKSIFFIYMRYDIRPHVLCALLQLIKFNVKVSMFFPIVTKYYIQIYSFITRFLVILH